MSWALFTKNSLQQLGDGEQMVFLQSCNLFCLYSMQLWAEYKPKEEIK